MEIASYWTVWWPWPWNPLYSSDWLLTWACLLPSNMTTHPHDQQLYPGTPGEVRRKQLFSRALDRTKRDHLRVERKQNLGDWEQHWRQESWEGELMMKDKGMRWRPSYAWVAVTRRQFWQWPARRGRWSMRSKAKWGSGGIIELKLPKYMRVWAVQPRTRDRCGVGPSGPPYI